jgi:hypothetical protein
MLTWDEDLQAVPASSVLQIQFPRILGQTDLPVEET